MSSHIKIHWHFCLEPFWTVLACKQCLICAYFWWDNCFIGGSNVTDRGLILAGSNGLKCGFFVNYCDIFISFLDSHSNGTHSLQRIIWWASDVMLNFSKSILMKKQTHIYLVWPESKLQFNFGWTIPLNDKATAVNAWEIICFVDFFSIIIMQSKA